MNNTLEDGLRILEFLAHADGPVALTEIADSLGLGKSKAHRLLQTLALANYVFQPAGSTKYLASIKLWSLGSAILRHDGLRTAAEPQMQQLMETTGESVHLSILEDLEIVYVHKVDSEQPVRAYSQIGGRMPAHLVATGKALLAFQSPASLAIIHDRLAGSSGLPVKEKSLFMHEMQCIRDSRIAINRGEWREGVYGIASPIMDRKGAVVAAIGVSGPSERFGSQALERYSDAVRQAAQCIAVKLFGEHYLPFANVAGK